MNKEFVLTKMKEQFGTQARFAEAIGIAASSVNEWFSRGVIPSSRLTEVFKLLGISSQADIDLALGYKPLSLSFRSKYDLSIEKVPEITRKNVEAFSRLYFSVSKSKQNSILKEIREELNVDREVESVVSKIRDFFHLSKVTPFDYTQVDYMLKKCGIDIYMIPFKSFGFNFTEEQLRALTAEKDDRFLVLCNSDRTYDEVMFDLTHEIIHILTNTVGVTDDQTLEKFIDSVAEMLIYPRDFLLGEFDFINDEGCRNTPTLFIENGFRDLMKSFSFYSPRGMAKALLSYGYLKTSHTCYDWMYNVEQGHYLKFFGKSMSEVGQMDFDFSDTFEFEEFIEKKVVKDIKKYPLFFDLVKGLVRGKITSRAFAKTFEMDSGDVNELRKVLKTKFDGLLAEA